MEEAPEDLAEAEVVAEALADLAEAEVVEEAQVDPVEVVEAVAEVLVPVDTRVAGIRPADILPVTPARVTPPVVLPAVIRARAAPVAVIPVAALVLATRVATRARDIPLVDIRRVGTRVPVARVAEILVHLTRARVILPAGTRVPVIPVAEAVEEAQEDPVEVVGIPRVAIPVLRNLQVLP